MSSLPKIQINFMSNRPSIQVSYDINEEVWRFCGRVGKIAPHALVDEGKTLTYMLIHQCQRVNTFTNRLHLVGTLITDPTKHLLAIELIDHFYLGGNADPGGAERETCAVCLEGLHPMDSGSTTNPLIPIVLGCIHAFHAGCLKTALILDQNGCPMCRRPLSTRDVQSLSHYSCSS